MNKKSIDKIEIFSLDFSYSNFLKDIFEIKSIDKFIDYFWLTYCPKRYNCL